MVWVAGRRGVGTEGVSGRSGRPGTGVCRHPRWDLGGAIGAEGVSGPGAGAGRPAEKAEEGRCGLLQVAQEPLRLPEPREGASGGQEPGRRRSGRDAALPWSVRVGEERPRDPRPSPPPRSPGPARLPQPAQRRGPRALQESARELYQSGRPPRRSKGGLGQVGRPGGNGGTLPREVWHIPPQTPASSHGRRDFAACGASVLNQAALSRPGPSFPNLTGKEPWLHLGSTWSTENQLAAHHPSDFRAAHLPLALLKRAREWPLLRLPSCLPDPAGLPAPVALCPPAAFWGCYMSEARSSVLLLLMGGLGTLPNSSRRL
eukprot:XP_024307340.1 collagen alpha-1(III) chain-like [Homo sapiens]